MCLSLHDFCEGLRASYVRCLVCVVRVGFCICFVLDLIVFCADLSLSYVQFAATNVDAALRACFASFGRA